MSNSNQAPKSKYVFLYKDKADEQDRDCVKYIDNDPLRFECNHYFGAVNLVGACFSMRLKREDIKYENITTILTEAEFEQLIQFAEAIEKLGNGIKIGDSRFEKGVQLCNGIRPIYSKLNSDENTKLFEKVVAAERKWLMDEYKLTGAEVNTIFDNYGQDYRDRGIIAYVYDSLEECAKEVADSYGFVTDQNRRWFDYEAFGQDLVNDDENYLELDSGKIVQFNY